VPRCGALSLLQKPLQYRGDPAETAATLNVKLCVLVVRGGGGRELLLKKTTLRYSSVAEDQQNFIVCRWTAALKSGGNARHVLVGLRRGNARHRSKHAATHLPPAEPLEAHAEILCRRR